MPITGITMQDIMIPRKNAALITFFVSIVSGINVVLVYHKEYFRSWNCPLPLQHENPTGKAFMYPLLMVAAE